MSAPASLVLGALGGTAFFVWEWLVRRGPVDGEAVGAIGAAVSGAILFRVDMRARFRRIAERDAERTRAWRERRRARRAERMKP